MNAHMNRARRAIAILAVLSLTAGFSINAHAAGIGPKVKATFIVTSTLDEHDYILGNNKCETDPLGPAHGKCTLRAAMDEANDGVGTDLVYNIIVPAGQFYLKDAPTYGPLTFEYNTINVLGNGSTRTVIHGPGAASAGPMLVTGLSGTSRVCHYGDDSVFRVGGRSSSNRPNATIQAVEIRDGANDYGGGLQVLGSTILSYDLIDCNEAGHGGGVNVAQSIGGRTPINQPVQISNSEISFNYAETDGGGVRNNGGRMTMDGTNVHDNYAGDSGGGVENFNYLSINNGAIRANAAGSLADTSSGYGGGIENQSNLRVTVTRILNNVAGQAGGGLNNYGGNSDFTDIANLDNVTMTGNKAGIYGGGAASDNRLYFTRSTISMNVAGTGVGTLGAYGGGIYNSDDVWLTDSQLIGNKAIGFDNGGGGLFSSDEGWVTNTTFVGNTADYGGGIEFVDSNCGGCDTTRFTLQGSTIKNNHANYDGGGVYLREDSTTFPPAPVRINDTQITGNSAQSDSGGLRNTPGIAACSGTTSITGNTASTHPNQLSDC